MSANNTTSCQDQPIPTQTWILLGVFLALAFFSRLITILLFKAISGACKSINAMHFDKQFRKLFMNPVAVLLILLFLQLAWNVAPWVCVLQWLKNVIGFLIFCAALIVVLVLIARLFDFAEVFARFFNLPPIYNTPMKEGIRVTKLAVLFFLGLLFSSLVILRIDPTNEFRLDLYFDGVNFISLCYVAFFVPVVRDAIGGATLLVEQSFNMYDWIEIDGLRGTVERIGLFTVVIRTMNGHTTMIANSRFVETVYIVYPFARRRVISFRHILTPDQCGAKELQKRALVANVEQRIRSLGVSDLFVAYESREDTADALDIRFATSQVTTVDAQVSLLNDAILQVTQATLKED